ncbi:MAG: adaptor protein MecA [Clostridium sp.]|nr:adaptor protein MecA [Clostridium sp.]
MRIEELSEERFLVELSAHDMEDLEISFEELDYANIETRRVIWTLLDLAGRELGRNIDPSGRMVVEVMPRGGGCVLHFTLIGQARRLVPRKSSAVPAQEKTAPLIFRFNSVDPLLDAAAAYTGLGLPLPQSTLYESKGAYRLLLYPKGGAGRLCAFFGEYGELLNAGGLAESATREYWRLLVKDGALERLAAACRAVSAP